MVLIKAGPAEILRASQKDDFVALKLQKICEDAVLQLGGPRRLIQHKLYIENLGNLLYYGATTLCGLQTLGEEYTGILQVNGSFHSIPSFINRCAMVILYCFGERITDLFLTEIEKKIKRSKDMRAEAKGSMLKWISVVRAFLPSVEILHKALFYCFWNTYHLSKRLTGIHYVLIRYWLRDKKSLFGFRLLGGITLVNLILFSTQTLKDLWSVDKSRGGTSEELEAGVNTYGSNSRRQCTMCLSPVKQPTATMCGHVFCWYCITDWAQTQDQCPICREQISLSRLIPLMNYI